MCVSWCVAKTKLDHWRLYRTQDEKHLPTILHLSPRNGWPWNVGTTWLQGHSGFCCDIGWALINWEIRLDHTVFSKITGGPPPLYLRYSYDPKWTSHVSQWDRSALKTQQNKSTLLLIFKKMCAFYRVRHSSRFDLYLAIRVRERQKGSVVFPVFM